MWGQPSLGQECTTNPLATEPGGQRTVSLPAQVGNGVGGGVLEPFQSPLGTKSKDTHTEAKVGASRESLAQVGVGREAKAAARENYSCPGGLSGSPASSFHPALKTLSFPVQDRCVVISCAVGGQRGAVWGGLPQLLPGPTAAPWGDGLPLSSLALTSPHAKALVCMEDTSSTLFRVPGPQPHPTPWGGLPWWSSPTS